MKIQNRNNPWENIWPHCVCMYLHGTIVLVHALRYSPKPEEHWHQTMVHYSTPWEIIFLHRISTYIYIYVLTYAQSRIGQKIVIFLSCYLRTFSSRASHPHPSWTLPFYFNCLLQYIWNAMYLLRLGARKSMLGRAIVVHSSGGRWSKLGEIWST